MENQIFLPPNFKPDLCRWIERNFFRNLWKNSFGHYRRHRDVGTQLYAKHAREHHARFASAAHTWSKRHKSAADNGFMVLCSSYCTLWLFI